MENNLVSLLYIIKCSHNYSDHICLKDVLAFEAKSQSPNSAITYMNIQLAYFQKIFIFLYYNFIYNFYLIIH